MHTRRGFTLIELLVVIAIIGVLAAIVLASLSTARNKGADTAVKGDLVSARTQAEIAYYNASPNSYAGICTDPIVTNQLKAAAGADGVGAGNIDSTLTDPAVATKVTCHALANGTAYAIQAPYLTNNANSWCIDNVGDSKQEPTYIGASVVLCPP